MWADLPNHYQAKPSHLLAHHASRTDIATFIDFVVSIVAISIQESTSARCLDGIVHDMPAKEWTCPTPRHPMHLANDFQQSRHPLHESETFMLLNHLKWKVVHQHRVRRSHTKSMTCIEAQLASTMPSQILVSRILTL
ncbi:hypothetical protein BDR03DRAFT_202439 [Suillus americanus]|nr:hypothetical protein BDR03DRAFT_202439 [Suillus americanus]